MARHPLSLLVLAVMTTSAGSFRYSFAHGTRSRPLQDRQRCPSSLDNHGLARADGLVTASGVGFARERRRRRGRFRPKGQVDGGDDDGSSARLAAENILRRLGAQELETLKFRLGIEEGLTPQDFMGRAVSMLAAKIKARGLIGRAEQDPEFRHRNQAEYEKDGSGRLEARGGGDSHDEKRDWGGETANDEAGEGWGENVDKRWQRRRPGSTAPHQHQDREPERPRSPGERDYFATCPRQVACSSVLAITPPWIGLDRRIVHLGLLSLWCRPSLCCASVGYHDIGGLEFM